MKLFSRVGRVIVALCRQHGLYSLQLLSLTVGLAKMPFIEEFSRSLLERERVRNVCRIGYRVQYGRR